MDGVYQAHYLTGAVQLISCGLVKGYIPGAIESAVRLGIKFWFADVGFSTIDSILGLLSPFLF